jgi:hypothetical protein
VEPAAARAVNRQAVGAAVIAIVIALMAGIGGIISYRSATDLVDHGEHATAKVVGFSRQGNSGSPHAVFIFNTQDGRSHRVVSNTYSGLAPHFIGETVPIVYYAGAPEAAQIQDGTLYGLVFFCAAFSCFCLVFAVMSFRSRHKFPSGGQPYIQSDGPQVTYDLSEDRGPWGIPKGRRLRFALWSCALLSLPIVAAVAGDRSVLIVVSVLTLGFEAFLLLFSSMPNQPSVEKTMKVTNFYGKGYLWFAGIFWSLLISFVVWRLWVQFPR